MFNEDNYEMQRMVVAETQAIGIDREIAILCRTNHDAFVAHDALRRAGIAAKLRESVLSQGRTQRFRFELACLRLLANKHNDLACKVIYRTYFPDHLLAFKKCQAEATALSVPLLEVLAREFVLFQAFVEPGAFKYAFDAVTVFLKQLPIVNFREMAVERTVFEELVEKEPHKLLTDFLADWSMSSIQDVMIGEKVDEKINVMTVHAAKGLEFENVIIYNAVIGVYPIIRKAVDLEEERRIFYVAMTRAEERLVILTQKGRESGYIWEIKN